MKIRRHEYKTKPRKCPQCGSVRVASILYGLPDYGEELERKLKEGRIILGGCCALKDDPTWQCADCDTPIYKKPLNEASHK